MLNETRRGYRHIHTCHQSCQCAAYKNIVRESVAMRYFIYFHIKPRILATAFILPAAAAAARSRY